MKKLNGVAQSMALRSKDPVLFAPLWSSSFVGNGASVNVSWSPAGPTLPAGYSMRIASVAPSFAVQIWNVDATDTWTEPVQSYTGHHDEILTLAWSPDGTHIASASEDRTVQVWDVQSGHTLLTHPTQSNGIRALAWSPDGRFLALGSDDTTVQVLDLTRGVHTLTYSGHARAKYGVDAVAWSPDGRNIASSGDDGTVQLWDATTGQCALTYRGHVASWALAVAWSPDGRWIASAGDDVQIWDARSGERLLSYRKHTTEQNWIDSVSWSPDSQLIASTSTDHVLHVWNAATGTNIQIYAHSAQRGDFEGVQAHTTIWSSATADSRRCVASACHDGTIILCHLPKAARVE